MSATRRRLGYRDCGPIVEPKTNGRATLWLDIETSTFSATVNQESFSDKDGEVVKRWALARLRDAAAFKWVAVIIVRAEHAADTHGETLNGLRIDPERCQLWFDVRRTYLAVAGSGKRAELRELRWQDHDATLAPTTLIDRSRPYLGAKTQIDLDALPHHGDDYFAQQNGQQHHVLSYDDDVYAGLLAIARVVNQAREDFQRLIMSDDASTMLASIGARGLRAGSMAFAQIAASSTFAKHDDRKRK